MFENRELKKIFGPKRDEARRCQRNIHTEEPYNL
jgi:hypothetical protein